MHVGLSRINRPGGMFSGSVSPPGVPLLEVATPAIPDIQITTQPQVAKPEKAASLSGMVLGRLTSLKPASDELKARLQEAISEAATLLAECDALEQECHSERRTNLERRHAEIRRQGRQQVALIKKLEKAFAEANGYWNQAREAKGQRQADLQQLLENQAGLSQWASDREITDTKIAVADAKTALAAAIERDNQAMQNYSRADSALESAQATLEEWGKQEAAVRAELAGGPYFDPSLGLSNADISKTGPGLRVE